MSFMKKYLLGVTTILILVSCNQQPTDNADNSTVESPTELVRVSGVSSKGPISAASIEIIAFDATDGSETGAPLATTTTDANGRWSVSIPAASHTAPLLIKSSGGEYLDESDPETDPTKKRRISLGANDTIYGVLFPGFSTSSVTMITSAIVEKSRLEANGSDFLNVLGNNQNLAASALGFDPFTVGAANPLAPASTASNDAIEYAMFLGGMATALNSAAILMGTPAPDFAIIQGFIDDMMDGRLNGQNQNGAITVIVNGTPTQFPANINLNQAITRFRNNNFAAYQATAVTQVVEVNEAALGISGVNASPVAQNDSLATVEGSSAITSNVLTNDSDPDGDSLSISSFTQPANGQAVNNNNGTFTYTPNPGFAGSDIFTYNISDGNGGSDSAQVIITVTATSVNADPIAGDDTATTSEDTPVTTQNLLGNDSDPDGDNVTVSGFTQASNGQVVNNNNGTFTYTPLAGFSGTDSFTYTISDGNGGSDTALVSITVTAASANINPTANAGTDQTVNELTAVTLTGSAIDSDGTISSFQWSQANGTEVTLNNADNSSATFTSPQVLAGNIDPLVFQLTVTDNDGGTDIDFITVIVNPVTIAPVANAGPDQTVNEQTLVTLNGSGSSDDIAISTYAWSQLSPVSPLALLSDTGAASPTFTGPDVANDTVFTFELTVTDNEGGSATDTVAITLISDNVGPTAVDDTDTTPEDTFKVINLVANDLDPSGNNFPLAIDQDTITQPANGTVTVEANGTDVTYTPDLNFNGVDTFTYRSVDDLGALGINFATVTVTVSGVNDNPVANPDTVSTIEDFPVIISGVTDNDTDPENDPLSVSGIASPAANGTVINNNDGTFTYTPNLDFRGQDSFAYSVVDGVNGSATGTVTITVVADTDGDGLVDTDEGPGGTGSDPNNPDTDGDGFSDGHELAFDPTGSTLLNSGLGPTITIISSTNLNNDINSDTTWTLENAPYWLQSDVNIRNGATLTIEPGVVIKSNVAVDIFVNNGGTLIAEGNVAEPQRIVFTSALDNSINGSFPTGTTTQPSDNDWAGIDFQSGSINGVIRNAAVKYGATCVDVNNSSPVIDNVEIGDCSSYGILMNVSSSTHSANLSSITFTDFDNDTNNVSTLNSSIRIVSGFSGNVTLNIDTLNINDTGTSTSNDHGLDIVANGGSINGTISNVTVVNPAADGINILNNSSGTVNIDMSNLTVNGSTANSLDVRNTSSGTVTTTFAGTNSFTNNVTTATAIYFQNNDPDFLASGSTTVDSAGYGLQLDNSAGSFRNFTLNNTAIAGVRLQNATNPLVFSNITLTNAVTPYELVGQNLTATIIAGYDFSDVSVTKRYIRVLGSLLADMTLTEDPLLTGSSVWRVPSNITIPSGVTLTVNDGAIVKFDVGTIVTVNGNLTIGDGIAGGANSILTSIRDDSVGGDSNEFDTLNSTTPPARGDWNYIQANSASNIDIDNAIIRYMDYGIFNSGVTPTSFSITNTTITEFFEWGLHLIPFADITITLNGVTISNGTRRDGIYVDDSAASAAITLDFDNITIDNVGDTTDDRGIELTINNNGSLTGRLDNITISNTAGNGIYLQDTGTGLVNPVFSGLNITNPGLYGLQLVGSGDGTTTPTVDNSCAPPTCLSPPTNFIGDPLVADSGGTYGLLIQGVNGIYNNITISNTTSSALYVSGTTNPSAWDDATIVLNNSPSPWTIRTNFPASIGTLGTADLGYTAGTGLNQLYVQLNSTLADSTLVADPLFTLPSSGVASVWRANTSVTIPSGVTLTVNNGAIVKFDIGAIVTVDGSLTTGDGVAGGTNIFLTSIRDDSVGGNTNANDATNADTLPARGDWNYIQANSGSFIDIDDATIRYMDYGIFNSGVTPSSFSITNSTITEFFEWGLHLIPFGDITITLNGVTISNGTRRDGIYIDDNTSANTITLDFDNVTIDNVGDTTDDRGIELLINNNGLLTGRLDDITISNTAGNGILLQNTGTGLVNPVFSGLDITNPGLYGLQLIGSSNGTTAPTVDNSCAPPTCATPPTNFIGDPDPLATDSGGTFGMLVQDVSGIYNNITISNTISSALFVSGSTNPSSWVDASIILNSSPSPWTIRTNFPASIGTLGTADLGYTAGTGLIELYAQANNTLANMTMVADPLGTGSSVWRVDSNITIPTDVTLTINNGAIVKFDTSVIVTVDGNLTIGDGVAGGTNIFLTSIRDDNVGGNTNSNDAANADTLPARSDWGYIQANSGSFIDIDDATIRYMDYGIFNSGVTPSSFSITNSTITEFFEWGLHLIPFGAITVTLDTVTISNGTRRDGIYIDDAGASTAITLDFDNVTIDNVGDTTDDRGIEFTINNSGSLTGRLDNVSVNNTAGSGILLQNTTGGLVNPAFSGITITNPGVHGMQLIGTGTGQGAQTVPTIDNVSGTSVIGLAGTPGSGGNLGLTFQGVNGTYSDFTIHSTNDSALYFSDDANPALGLNVTLDNSPSPYTLIGMNLPLGVTYTSGTGLVEDYARITGTLIGDVTLAANPLGAGTYWQVPPSGSFDLEVPSGVTLTIEAGAVLKFESGADLNVQNGGTLNVNGTTSSHVVMTSTTDTRSAGGFDLASANVALIFDWEGVNFNAGSASGTASFLDVWYARDCIDFTNVNSNPVFNNLTVNYCQDGLRINSSTSMTLTFNDLASHEHSSNHIVLEGSGSLSTTFTETTADGLTITDIPSTGGDAVHGIFISNTDSTNVVAGFTIDGTSNPIRYSGSGAHTTENNIVRNARSYGIYNTSNGNPLIRNNIVVQGALSGMFISGNGNVFGNLIRQNSNGAGGGIFISSSSVTLENNLIVENRSTSNTSNSGGSGIYINGNSSPTIINNTIANNVSSDGANFEGAGINIESSAGAITLRDNILFGNTDVANGANDLYDDLGRISIASNNLIGALLDSPGSNLYTADITDIIASDPLFVEGWYLDSNGAPLTDSPAIDAGSTDATNILPIPLNTRTTRTDGGLDDGSVLPSGDDTVIVNLGYHYAAGSLTADPATTLVTSNPASPVSGISSGTPVVITITPRDAIPATIGAGLDVQARVASNLTNPSDGNNTTTGTNSTLSTVDDLGDGSYEVTFTPDAGFAGSDTISFTVNGVAITAVISVDWVL